MASHLTFGEPENMCQEEAWGLYYCVHGTLRTMRICVGLYDAQSSGVGYQAASAKDTS